VAATDLLIKFKEELAEIGVKAGKSPVTFIGAGIAVLGFIVIFVMAIRKYLNQSDHDSIGDDIDGRDVDLNVEDPEFSGDDWDIESFDEETQSNPMKDQDPPDPILAFDTSCDEIF
jgi:hypothetical protein